MNDQIMKIGFLAFLLIVNLSIAEPSVPEGFIVQKIMNQIDGQTPRLEAIRNPNYGSGVVAASVNNGILTVLKISEGNIQILSTHSGFDDQSVVRTIRFDHTGLFQNSLFVSVSEGVESYGNGYISNILKLEGDFLTLVGRLGTLTNELDFMFDFSDGSNGYQQGAYLLDRWGGGTAFYLMDLNYNFVLLTEDAIPSYRDDIDINAMEFDTTTLYGSNITMIDHDANDSQESVIFQLYKIGGQWEWSQLTLPVNTNLRHYRDMCFSHQGTFGKTLYITDRVTNTIMTVDPNGIHDVYASDFYEIESITVDDTGEFMYVSDDNGIWLIKAGTNISGPQPVMQEPKVSSKGVFTDPNGIDSVRLLWNDSIVFDNDDIEIVDGNVELIPFSVTGSGSQFMIIAFGESLLNDKYTITIKDTVVSTLTGASIDGGNDGQAGGDYVFTMEHRERYDGDNDNDVDLYDLSELAEKWLWEK